MYIGDVSPNLRSEELRSVGRVDHAWISVQPGKVSERKRLGSIRRPDRSSVVQIWNGLFNSPNRLDALACLQLWPVQVRSKRMES
jgi:hypothetical protein